MYRDTSTDNTDNDRDHPGDSADCTMLSAFTCRIDTVKTITDVLTCLCVNLKKDHPCHIQATPDGLIFLVTGRAKSTQASADLKADLFEEYICESDVHLALNLTTLLECLLLFGSSSDNTVATMTYSAEDAMFRLSLQEQGIMTSCDLTAMYSEGFDELDTGLSAAFREGVEESAVLVVSEPLKEAVTELMEVSGAGSVTIDMSPSGMRLSTRGSGENMCEINFPHDSKVFILFRCDKSAVWTFPLPSLQLGMKALGVAKETYMRINAEGIMSIQHQIENLNHQETFVNFLMIAEETLSEERSGDHEDGREEEQEDEE